MLIAVLTFAPGEVGEDIGAGWKGGARVVHRYLFGFDRRVREVGEGEELRSWTKSLLKNEESNKRFLIFGINSVTFRLIFWSYSACASFAEAHSLPPTAR